MPDPALVRAALAVVLLHGLLLGLPLTALLGTH